MRRSLPAVVLLVFLAGTAAAQEVAQEIPTLASLTREAASLQQDIRRAHSPEARKRLLERLELLHHQMGPTDAAGRPVHCQAMWHDRTLDRLGQEMKRLSGREVDLAEAQGGALVRLGRLHVRRMAQACLTHGWRIYTGPEKYQVGAFGQYLANNLPTLDGLLKRLSGLSGPAAGGESAAKAASTLEKARSGLAKMIEAADALAEAPAGRPEALIAPLSTFMEGLTAVREAADGVQAAEPETPGDEAPAETEPAQPPPMTETEKQRIDALREAAAALDDPAWAGVTAHVQRFASMIEAGFTVASARPKARELLAQTERAVGLARNLASSTLLDEALLAGRRDDLLQSLTYMAQPAYRATGYARLARLRSADAFRRRVERAGLSPVAGQGLVQAYYHVAPKWEKSTSAQAIRDGGAMVSACSSIVRTLERMRGWPPADMAAQLQSCYRRQSDLFVGGAEAAGARVRQDPQEALSLMQAAAQRGADLALIVRAETVVEAIKRYRPRQAGTMYQRIISAAQGLVLDTAGAGQARMQLAGLVRPFENLETFPVPDPALGRTLSGLLGRVYSAAVAKLSRDLGVGINFAAAGNSMALRQALRADALFRLARKRALAEQAKLQRAPVANLVAFSMPADLWATFHGGLDRRLQAMFTAYTRGQETGLWWTEPAALEAVYGPVVAAQRLTLEARSPGEPDLDFLMRNLHRVAVPDPPRPTRDAWAVGYHATEAVATTIADLDVVAEWHRRRMRLHRRHLDRVDLSAPQPDGSAGR
ncbi:MAG: hypothetical protein U9R68_01160 [Planctomycetota bacterium]|nr:hypothetical protein [Planctomycetota bacterium]